MICGPSGVGKTTLCNRLQENGFGQSLTTCTSRPPRPGEVNGQHYHFIETEQFKNDIANGKFVEHAEVHGNLYGIRRGDIKSELYAGNTLILNIDVQGASTLREIFPDHLVDVFIDVASIETLRQRLESRKEDSKEVIENRLAEAEVERQRKNEFMQVLINDHLDTCYKELESFITAYRKEQHV